MSVSRKNWSALSSLTRQWTVEDKEEEERERRRRLRSSSSTTEPDDDLSQPPSDVPTTDSTHGTHCTGETPQGLSSVEQMQQDFEEILRTRDETRRKRQVETLRRQKQEEEGEAEADAGGRARVELLGDVDVDEPPLAYATSKPQEPVNEASLTNPPTTSTVNTNTQHENGESLGKDPEPSTPSSQARKFVSSVSISLDISPSTSGRTTPMSPRSPTMSPRESCLSPCQSPPAERAQSPFAERAQSPSAERAQSPSAHRAQSLSAERAQSAVQNGHTQLGVNGSSSNASANSEQKNTLTFVRQSSRTASFRMLRKKEVEKMPLQRSASVRITSKIFEPNTDQNQEEAPGFQRNSRQRMSSRSIQEKMERLTQASQKSETSRSTDVTQRTLFLMEEVSRKRGLFEKEQQASNPTSPTPTRHEFRGISGMSDRIHRWLNKSNQTASSHSPTDLRHVDINSKRSLFENREDGNTKATPGKI
ncbi:ladinin-1 isoform X2 [Genypterus blacodes]|uniref:ladinin-1 isoform X2 n=1 Tax=Genypterus blacodes TaxID=154954 RepID=UPI003F7669F5